MAAHNPGADFLKAVCSKVFVNIGVSALVGKEMVRRIDQVGVVQTLEGARGEEPLHQPDAADAEAMLEALAGAGAVTIQRNAEAVDPYFLHVSNPSCRISAPGNYARSRYSLGNATHQELRFLSC